ncbi:hypothetical protein QX204_09660 [Nocardia sp. PE-7]|uniref:hypothetical protein n=1 Tax=Nocardia sp. PE-7 TaxID=3058426 RepID=UPI0026581210|nr:hypothetical protein [Nocardia sp. PE-7]WKG11696.1 hypothetical protein QX204_09660 [Nocardia sp. PE-7]
MNTGDTPKSTRRQPNPVVQAAAAKTRKRRKRIVTLPTDPTPGQLPLFPVSDLDPEAHR